MALSRRLVRSSPLQEWTGVSTSSRGIGSIGSWGNLGAFTFRMGFFQSGSMMSSKSSQREKARIVRNPQWIPPGFHFPSREIKVAPEKIGGWFVWPGSRPGCRSNSQRFWDNCCRTWWSVLKARLPCDRSGRIRWQLLKKRFEQFKESSGYLLVFPLTFEKSPPANTVNLLKTSLFFRILALFKSKEPPVGVEPTTWRLRISLWERTVFGRRKYT